MPDGGQTLLLQPRDPIILRDARPFTDDPGSHAVTLDWPLPQTVAGALRTHIGTAAGFDWNGDGPDRARQIAVQGPFLVARYDEQQEWRLYLPAPRDAVVYRLESPEPGAKSIREIRALRPAAPTAGSGCNLPNGRLRPLAVEQEEKPEPPAAFWSLEDTFAWLRSANPPMLPRSEIAALPRDTRVHVKIDRTTRAAEEGHLFSTQGLAFREVATPSRAGSSGQPALAMLCRVESAPSAWQPASGILSLGGERRLVALTPLDGPADPWPRPQPALIDAVRQTSRLRVQLLTPALFANGWLPGWLDPQTLEGELPGAAGIRLRLVSAAVGRPTAVSGWDLAGRPPGPKATRYAAPAGSIYFFDLPEGSALDEAQIRALWLQAVSDGEQDRRDGFGLIVPGVW